MTTISMVCPLHLFALQTSVLCGFSDVVGEVERIGAGDQSKEVEQVCEVQSTLGPEHRIRGNF